MNPSKQRILLWFSVIIGLLILVFGLSYLGTRTASNGGTLSMETSVEDHTKGSVNPKATLVEYSDFQCPACAAYYPVVKQIAEAYPNDVQIAYRHFPLTTLHKNALPAAKAAVAASFQNKFWEMHDVLFNTQDRWADDARAEEKFTEYAQSIGLDVEQFKSDMKSDPVSDRVDRDGKSGRASGVQGTPTFFLNGKKIELRAYYDDFDKAIREAIRD